MGFEENIYRYLGLGVVILIALYILIKSLTFQGKIIEGLTNSTTVTVKVVDVTGKIVYSSNEGTQNNGSHKLNIDASAFTNGVYYVTVSTDETQVTKKMIKN